MVYMDAGSELNNTLKLINIRNIALSLDETAVNFMPGFHALTGCNVNTSYIKKGKLRPF